MLLFSLVFGFRIGDEKASDLEATGGKESGVKEIERKASDETAGAEARGPHLLSRNRRGSSHHCSDELCHTRYGSWMTRVQPGPDTLFPEAHDGCFASV